MPSQAPDHRVLTNSDKGAPPLLDALAAVLVVGIFWLPPTMGSGDPPRLVAGLVLAAITGGVLVLRRRFPMSSAVGAALTTVTGTAIGVCEDPMLATAWCLYPLAIAHARHTRPLVLVLACLLAAVAAVTGIPGEDVGGVGQRFVVAAAALSVAWMLGIAVGRQIATARDAERARVQLEVARDVHDVVGHALGLISAEAGVTRSLPDAGEQELRDSLADIEGHARNALEEVQDVVRALRARPAPLASTGPTGQGIAHLASVVATTRAAGVPVDARIEVMQDVDDGVGAVVFRIVQESLSNVVRHASGAGCAVDVHEELGVVLVRVRDHGPGAGPDRAGFGLQGMCERARLVGGAVTWRNHPEGGFEVTARLPARGAG